MFHHHTEFSSFSPRTAIIEATGADGVHQILAVGVGPDTAFLAITHDGPDESVVLIRNGELVTAETSIGRSLRLQAASGAVTLETSTFSEPDTIHQIDVARSLRETHLSLDTPLPPPPAGLLRGSAISADGTTVPYQVHVDPQRCPRDANGALSPSAVVLYVYGGFGVVPRPFYSPAVRGRWLALGASYGIAHVRGGGESGPAWHAAGMRSGKKLSACDAAAVVADVHVRGWAVPETTGIHAMSNGALPACAMALTPPDDPRYANVGAVACQVPLADLGSFPATAHGRTWIPEYGDPDDPAQWKGWIRDIDPLSLARRAAAHGPRRRLPQFLITGYSDDDVTPGEQAVRLATALRATGADVTAPALLPGTHVGAMASADRDAASAALWGFFARTLLGSPSPPGCAASM